MVTRTRAAGMEGGQAARNPMAGSVPKENARRERGVGWQGRGQQ